jgi:phosphoribosyl-ATP pyrophosphohydrolase/phosphoribosyl-AMP cyclohydrolase/histidinol dehydrogenase
MWLGGDFNFSAVFLFCFMMIVNFKEDKDLLPNIAIATTVLLDEDLFTFERFGNRIWIRTTFNSQFESVLALLDSGIEVVVINFSHLSGLTMTQIESGLENIPSNRLCLEFEPDMKNPGVGPNFKAMCPLFDNFIVKNPPIEVILTLQVSFPDNNFIVHSMEFLQNLEKGVKFMVDIEHLAIGPKNGKTNFVDLLLFNSKSDREDGLLATMVTDRQGVALGLCYSSKESIEKALETRTGVYFSRKRGLWYKGRTSGATQKLHTLTLDCDNDTLRFKVTQTNPGFCHLNTRTCFGQDDGITALVSLLEDRIKTAPEKSYTKRLFNDKDLLQSKILEEAEELCDATTKEDIAWETADLLYFAMVKCISAGVSLSEIENNLLTKSRKISRRPGNAKPPKDITESKQELEKVSDAKTLNMKVSDAKSCNMTVSDAKPFNMKVYDSKNLSKPEYEKLLLRPIINTKEIMERVKPIVQAVRERGDLAIKEFTKKFDNVDLDSIVLKHPYPEHLMKIDPKVKLSIDLAFANVEKFHIAQLDQPLVVETMPGVICSRFSRPIERVGLYVPGNYNGTEFRIF